MINKKKNRLLKIIEIIINFLKPKETELLICPKTGHYFEVSDPKDFCVKCARYYMEIEETKDR